MSSIGGLDPLADAYNLMGAQGMTMPNPYLEFTGQIPMAGYRGTPTDASGKPIQSFLDAQAAHDAWKPPAQPAAPTQGTTLNSTPNDYGAANALRGFYAGQGNPQIPTTPSFGGSQYAVKPQFGAYIPQAQAGPAAAPATPAAPTNPIDMRQAYLDALSNPGKVTTPGAQMLPGTTMTGPIGSQPSVLQNFLAQHPGGGTTGGGGYGNQAFFSTLNALKQPGATS